MLIAIGIVAGIIAVWFFETLIDLVITSRVMDDPMKGKMLATVVAYFLVVTLSALATNSPNAIFIVLPGALLVGFLEMRSAAKIQQRIDAKDESSTFE